MPGSVWRYEGSNTHGNIERVNVSGCLRSFEFEAKALFLVETQTLLKNVSIVILYLIYTTFYVIGLHLQNKPSSEDVASVFVALLRWCKILYTLLRLLIIHRGSWVHYLKQVGSITSFHFSSVSHDTAVSTTASKCAITLHLTREYHRATPNSHSSTWVCYL